MFHIKVVFFLAVVLNSVFARVLIYKEITENIIADQSAAPDTAAVKTNEQNNVFVPRNSKGDINDSNQPSCKAPNGLGLQNLFREAQKLLPKEQIKAVLKSYPEDPEIKAVQAFVSDAKTVEKVKNISNSQDYQVLKDYSCRTLHIVLPNYNKFARILLNPLLMPVDTQPRKGVRGFLSEMNAVVPRQQLRELYQNLLTSDGELVKAVANLKSKEFLQLLSNVKNNVPQYKVLVQQVKAVGVPVQEMHETLANALQWPREFSLLI